MVLEVRHITKTFPGVTALDDVSIGFSGGEVHALVGENGAGKSTLIKLLAGRYPPDAGQILCKDKIVEIADPLKASQLGISIVYQEYNLVPKLSVTDNIFLGREPADAFGRIDRKAARRSVAALSERLHVAINPDSFVADLGTAEAKTVEIIKALSSNAEILVLDEPTAALPEKDVESLFTVIRSLRTVGVTVIYISHRLEEIFSIADRVSVLKDGRLVGTWQVAEINHDFLVRSMIGRDLKDVFPARTPSRQAALVLSGRELEDERSLKNVSFDLHEGEIIGVGGMTGNGQREFIRALFGAHRLTGGTVRFRGQEVKIESPAQALTMGIGFISDDRRNEGLSITQSVLRNLCLPSLHQRQTAGLIQRDKERKTAEDIVRDLHIKLTSLSQAVQSMSGGNQQRVVIGKWIPIRPSILLFHEPTLGIDVGAKAEIYRLMHELSLRGVAILMVTSDMIELLNVPDRILVFCGGHISAEFRKGEATEEAVMFAASGTPEGESAPAR